MVIMMSLLALLNIGNRYLWYDEAHTALVGQNVLKYGLPKVWNGKYLITTSNGNDFDDSLIIIKDGFVQYYLAAFGELLRQWVHPRTVFALLGVAGSVVLYLLTKEMTNNIKISLLSMFIYCTSIPIILYIRQVRYYSPAIFFCLLVLLAYILAVKYNKKTYWSLFTLSAILLYHTLHLFFMVVMISIFLRYIIFDKNKENVKKIIVSLIAVFIFSFPAFLHNQIFLSSVGDQRSSFQGWYYFFLQIPGYLSQINAYFFPFVSLAVIYFVIRVVDKMFSYKKQVITNDQLVIRNNKKLDPNLFLILTIVVVNVLITSAFSVQYATRYLIPSVLMSIILCAYTIRRFLKKDRILSAVLSFLMIFTNFLNIIPYVPLKNLDDKIIQNVSVIVKPPVPYFTAQGNFIIVDTLTSYLNNKLQYDSYFGNYIQEISSDYDDATEGVIKYLNENAKPGDVVQADDFLSDSIAYYRVGEDNDFWYTIYNKLPNIDKYLHLTYYPEELVKWQIILPNSKAEVDELYKSVDESKYEIIEVLGYPNAMFAADIWEHSFVTDESYPNAIILRNISIP